MKNILARGGIEFLAVFLGIALSLYVDEWRQIKEIKERLESDYININKEIIEDIKNIDVIIHKIEDQIFSLNKLISYHEKKIPFNKMDVATHIEKITSPTFFGTQSAYNASVSSGRFNFSESLIVSNEISVLYDHFYNRLSTNSELYDGRMFKLKSDYIMPFYKITMGGNEFSDVYVDLFYQSDFGSSLYWVKEFVEYHYIIRLLDTKEQMVKTDRLIKEYLGQQ